MACEPSACATHFDTTTASQASSRLAASEGQQQTKWEVRARSALRGETRPTHERQPCHGGCGHYGHDDGALPLSVPVLGPGFLAAARGVPAGLCFIPPGASPTPFAGVT